MFSITALTREGIHFGIQSPGVKTACQFLSKPFSPADSSAVISVKVNLIQQLFYDISFFLLGHYRTPPFEYHICEPFTQIFLQGRFMQN